MREGLTFDDCNIIPQYSEVASRDDVDLTTNLSTNFKLKIPLIASPMDTVTGLSMAISMCDAGGLGVLHRFMSIEEQTEAVKIVVRRLKNIEFRNNDGKPLVCAEFSPVAAAIGVNGDSKERATKLLEAGVNVLMIDVAHGHHKNVKDMVEWLNGQRKYFSFDIIAGSIATRDAARDLQEWGVDGLRVGVGGGCFVPNTQIRTELGLENIKDIIVGTKVYTHTGELQEVLHKFEFDRDEEIICINGIECTKNHEFYVVNNADISKITDENIHQFAKWIPADKLDKNWQLIEIE